MAAVLPTRRVYNTLVSEIGEPLVGVKIVAKICCPAGLMNIPAEVVDFSVETVTDARGYWFLDLVPTDIFRLPDICYEVIEGNHRHIIQLPSGDTPVWLYDLIVPEEICRRLFARAVTSIRIPGRYPLIGDIELRPGAGTWLEQSDAPKYIAVHLDYADDIQPVGTSSSPGTSDRPPRSDHVHEGVHSLDAMTGDIQITPTQGILKDDDTQNNQIILFPNYGTEIQPVAASSSSGSINRFARVDHVHEGVHSLDGMTGDVVIDATQGLRKIDDMTNKKIILKSTHAIYLTPDDFRAYGAITKDFFPWRTNENVSFTATHTTGGDVTGILTDGNYGTAVVVNSDNSITLMWVTRSVYAVRFYVSAVRTGGTISISVQDADDTTIGSAYVSVAGVGWYDAIVRAAPHGTKAIIQAFGGAEPGAIADIDIAEVRVVGGVAIPALFTGVRWGTGMGYSEGVIQSTCFLYAGWHYRYRAWFGSTDDASKAIVEGRLYDENGLVTIFRPKGGLGNGTNDQLIVLSGDLLTPTQSKFFVVEWLLISDGRTGLGGDPHFLGMLIEFE